MLGQQDQPAGRVPMEATIDYAENDGPTVLGDRLNNPYTIENMTAAKAYLTGAGIVSENNFDVRVTHYYVKFTPRTEYELEQLWQDSTLNLYDCPLDYDKVVVGNWYREPGLPDSMPTPQYAAVKAGFSFNPAISYEILASLYIPEEDQTLIGPAFDENRFYMESLLNQAYTQSGIGVHFELADPYDDNGGGTSVSVPSGTIRIFDTRLNQDIPLEGVRVTASRWFTTYQGITMRPGITGWMAIFSGLRITRYIFNGPVSLSRITPLSSASG